MRTNIVAYMFATLTLGLIGEARALTPNDFAYGAPLAIQQPGAIHRVTLPRDVYVHAVRGDLGDLRVFNGADEVVPYALRGAAPAPKQHLQSLPLFALYATAHANNDSRIQLRIDDAGRATAIALDTRNSARNNAPKILRGYVVDARALSEPAQALLLHWPPVAGNMSAELEIAVSDDLSHWRTLTADGTIAHLRHGAQVLQQNRVALPAGSYAYLRLTTDQTFPVKIDRVEAEVAAAAPPTRHWLPLAATPLARGEYVLRLPGQVPAERIRIVPPGAVFLSRVELASRAATTQPWVARTAGLIYRLQVKDSPLASEELALSYSFHREWRLKFLQNEGIGGGVPHIEMGWTPQELLFVASGAGPFRLVFGSAAATPAMFPIADILPEATRTATLAVAEVGATAPLGGEVRRTTQPAGWGMRVALWLLLALGVVALAAMAWHLYRNLQAPPPS